MIEKYKDMRDLILHIVSMVSYEDREKFIKDIIAQIYIKNVDPINYITTKKETIASLNIEMEDIWMEDYL